ncbi:MAG: SDR family oxidoreductase [Bdellovibrionales bacterium]|nr:SDR family oxidoreductase [Bdellovibrionales bacterium]
MATPKLALVTGGSRGLGKAMCELLSARGVQVVAPGREELDLSSSASIDAFLKTPVAGKIDILINNAGINNPEAIEQISDKNWQETLQINLTAPLKLIQGVAPGMKARGWGRIVNVSSVFSVVTREKRAAYSAVKSGLNGLTRTAAVELAPFGILVNSIAPGYVDTDLTRKNNPPEVLEKIIQTIPARRLAKPNEIVETVAFLVSEANGYLTGQTVVVDGGFSSQ